MPDPWRYLAALTLTAFAAGLLAFAKRSMPLALAGATACGLGMLRMPPSWPPATGLDRLLLLVLPSVMAVEWWAGRGTRDARGTQFARIVILLLAGPMLLLDSVHLDLTSENAWRTFAGVATSIMLVLAAWTLSRATLRKSPEAAPRLGVACGLGTITAGIVTLLGGYLRGGATAMVLGTALASAVLGQASAARRQRIAPPTQPSDHTGHAAGAESLSYAWLAVGLAMLHGVVFVGLHFGRLLPLQALIILLTPCLAAFVERLPITRRLSAVVRPAACLIAVVIPLVFLIVFAKQAFDRRMGPLLELPASSGAGIAPAVAFVHERRHTLDEKEHCPMNRAIRILASRPGKLHNRDFAKWPVRAEPAPLRIPNAPPAPVPSILLGESTCLRSPQVAFRSRASSP